MALDQQSYARARNAALGGLVIQAGLFMATLVTAYYTGSPLLFSMTWHTLAGVPVWIILWMIFNQHRLERIESLEAEQLSRADAATATIFTENADDLQLARRRLDNLYKWGVPAVSLLIATFLVSMGGYLIYANYGIFKPLFTDKLDTAQTQELYNTLLPPHVNTGIITAILAAFFFVSFIFARYAAGMTKIAEWSPLRGGASYLMGNFLVALLAFISMVFVFFENRTVLAVVSIVVPVIVTILGIEIILAQLLAMYRPRKPGEIPRAAFDSRLLGMLTSPKSLGKAITDTINYQFGFEVSRSWFYQLLSRAITPLIIFGVIILFAISTIVVIPPDSEGVRMTFGALDDNAQPLTPGLHFKWPWPVGSVDIRPVARVQQLSVGSAPKGVKEGIAILWTNEHVDGGKEDYLVCAPTPIERETGTPDAADLMSAFSNNKKAATTRPGNLGGQLPGVNLIGGQVVVQFRIKDTLQYAKVADDPIGLLQRIVERRTNSFFVTHDIDTLLGPGREVDGRLSTTVLREQIQGDVNDESLGIEIVFVGLSALHPPKDTANAFHEQISVLQERQSEIENAEKERINLLGTVAGTPDEALAIRDAIRKYDEAKRALMNTKLTAEERAANEKRVNELEADAERLLIGARGKAAQTLAEARREKWERYLAVRSQVDSFNAELEAYRRAPEFYKMRKYLEVLASGLEKPRKFVVTSDSSVTPTFRIDLKESSTALGDVLNIK